MKVKDLSAKIVISPENRVLTLRASVELFAECHDVDPLRTESGADGKAPGSPFLQGSAA